MDDKIKTPVVSVYGSSMVGARSRDYREAQRMGSLLASAGARVACGGYGGVMEAVSRGATTAGGHVTGYTVAAFKNRSPNPFLSEERRCSDLYERLKCLIHESDAMVALNGGIGTLVEVFLAWNELYMGLISPRPLVLVGEIWETAVARLSSLMELRQGHLKLVNFCSDTDSALALLKRRGVVG
ncbi:MAG: LOG family protein [Candidatus Binatia bacterium]